MTSPFLTRLRDSATDAVGIFVKKAGNNYLFVSLSGSYCMHNIFVIFFIIPIGYHLCQTD